MTPNPSFRWRSGDTAGVVVSMVLLLSERRRTASSPTSHLPNLGTPQFFQPTPPVCYALPRERFSPRAQTCRWLRKPDRLQSIRGRLATKVSSPIVPSGSHSAPERRDVIRAHRRFGRNSGQAMKSSRSDQFCFRVADRGFKPPYAAPHLVVPMLMLKSLQALNEIPLIPGTFLWWAGKAHE